MSMKRICTVLLFLIVYTAYAYAQCGTCVITNPPPSIPEEYAAANYLCSTCVIDNPVGGDVNPFVPIIKEDLAKVAYKSLFGTTPPSFVTQTVENYPNPYQDMNGNDPYQRFGRVMLYLEYGDGKSPFTRNNYYYYPGNTVTRAQVCKVLVETFNLPLVTVPTPYADVNTATEEYAYITTCYNKGLIIPQTNFSPTAPCNRIDAFLIFYRYLNNPANVIPTVTLDDFAMPDNLRTNTLNRDLGIDDAVFNDYSEVCFNLPDIEMALSFGHSYNSYLSFLPDAFMGFTNTSGTYNDMRPFGPGWTHNFNAYITKFAGYAGGTSGNGDNEMVVFWPNGAMDVYKDPSLAKVTLDNFDIISYNNALQQYTIKKKNQVEYFFTKISGSDANAPFMLTAVKDRNNNQMTMSYAVVAGGKPRLSTVTVPSGRTLSFGYSGTSSRITAVTESGLNRTVFYTYLPEATLATYKDADEYVTTYGYESFASGLAYLLKTVQRPNGNTITNSYNARRKLTNTTVVNNGVTYQRSVSNYAWNGNNPANGTTATVQTNDGANTYNATVVKNNRNDVTNLVTPNIPTGATMEYDDPMYPTLPTSVTVFGVTNKIEYSQDNKGNRVKTTQDFGGFNYISQIAYNANNDPISVTNPRGKTTTMVYGDGKNLTQVNRPIGSATMTYFPNGLMHTSTSPDGILTTLGYNTYGNVTNTTISKSGTSISTITGYDNASRPTSYTDGNGKTSYVEYNNRDLPIKETDALNHQTLFGYDGNANLVTIQNAKGGVTTLDYDDLDQQISEQFGPYSRNFEYYSDGKLKKIIKPDGTNLQYNYFADDGLLQSDDYATYTYDARKRPFTVTKDGKTITFNYDNIDRVSSIAYDGQTVAYTYDANGNLLTMTYPGNKVVTYTYDDNDRLTKVEDWNNQITTYTYCGCGRLESISYPNGVLTTYSYDPIGRPTGITTQKGGTTIFSHAIAPDNNGNHLSETKQDPFAAYPVLEASGTTYAYDNINRIISANTTAFTFDNNGNMLTKTGRTFAWDKHDMLTSVNTAIGTPFNATYEYDGLGNRRRAVRNGTPTKYVLDILGMSRVLMETNDAGTPQNYYVYGLSLISRIKPNNDTRYYHADFRGSAVALTNPAGTITHKYQYDEFGAVVQKIEEDFNPFRLVGLHGVMYEDSTLVFMRARYYDAEIGRFLSEDPIWSVNLYPYADNNPINFIDPLGTKKKKANCDIGIEGAVVIAEVMAEFIFKGNLPKKLEKFFLAWDFVPAAGKSGYKFYILNSKGEALGELFYPIASELGAHFFGPAGILGIEGFEATQKDIGNIFKYGFKSFANNPSKQSWLFQCTQVVGDTLYEGVAKLMKWSGAEKSIRSLKKRYQSLFK
ncbi:hypothetical protein B6N25_08400 [Sphingobacteriales bacterium TSM_CSS]|nr:hypothetical protein B6N25_08400 [Sphingobacteriales bacterium TSM_CSS]